MTFSEAESSSLPNQKHSNFMACYLLSCEFLLLLLIIRDYIMNSYLEVTKFFN